MGRRFGAAFFYALVPINNKRRLRLRRKVVAVAWVQPWTISISAVVPSLMSPTNTGKASSVDNSARLNPMGMLGSRAYCI